MTKKDFLDGKIFKVKLYLPSTFRYMRCDYNAGYLIEQTRLSSGELVSKTHCLNIDKIGNKAFSGYSFVVGKYISVKYRYEDLIEWSEENTQQ